MLDLHNHVLPGLDDGARNLDEAIGLLQAQVRDGVQHVVCTPHMYPGVFDNTLEVIERAFIELSHEVTRRELAITLSFAAEVRVCAELLDWLREGRLPLLGGSATGRRAVLLELPDGVVPLGTEQVIEEVVGRGIEPIIAHPERNRAVMLDPDKLLPLLKRGARLQVTAGSLLGEFGAKAKLSAMTLLQRNQVDFVASDSHNLGARRPRMKAARAWLVEHFGEDLAERLTETNPAAVAGVGAVVLTTAAGWSIRDMPKHAREAPPPGTTEPSQAAPPSWGADMLTDWTRPSQRKTAAEPKPLVDVEDDPTAPGWQRTRPMPLDEELAEPTQKATQDVAPNLGQLEFPTLGAKWQPQEEQTLQASEPLRFQLDDTNFPAPPASRSASTFSAFGTAASSTVEPPLDTNTEITQSDSSANTAHPTTPAMTASTPLPAGAAPASVLAQPFEVLHDVVQATEQRKPAAPSASHLPAPREEPAMLKGERPAEEPATSTPQEPPHRAATALAEPEVVEQPTAPIDLADDAPGPAVPSPPKDDAPDFDHTLPEPPGNTAEVTQPGEIDAIGDEADSAVSAEPTGQPPQMSEKTTTRSSPGLWARILGWLFGRTHRDGTPAPLALESRLDRDDAAYGGDVDVEPTVVAVKDVGTTEPMPIGVEGPMPTTDFTETETALPAPDEPAPAAQATRGFKLSEFDVVAPKRK